MRTAIGLLILLCIQYATGQDLKFGNVTKYDFNAVVQDTSTQHDAVLILNETYISFVNYKQYITVHQRIRIETEEGLDYATRQITLYTSPSGSEVLKSVEGITYNLVGDNIQKSRLDEEEVFEEDINENYFLNSFTMPDVRIGSVIEYAYVIESPFPYIDDINIQNTIPTIHLDLQVQFPSYCTYNVVFNPRASFKIKFNPEDFKEGVTFSEINADDSDDFSESQKVQQLTVTNQVIGFKETNIPALLPEPMSGDIDRYRAKMIINIATTNDPDSGRVKRKFGTSWEAVAKSIYYSDKFGREIKRSSRFYREDLETAIMGIEEPKEKVTAILSFLKSMVKWNDKYGVFTNEGIKEAYQLGSGNVAEVNLLLVSMLREAEIEAYPVLVSTVSNDIPIFPTREGFNYVIVQALVGEEKLLLDGTEKFAGIDLIPLRAANWKGRLIRKDGSSEWIPLSIDKKSDETVFIKVQLDDDYNATGEVAKRLTNHLALDSRIQNNNINQEQLERNIQNDVLGLEVAKVEVEGLNSTAENLTYKYQVTYKNAYDQIGDKLYVSPLLFEASKENPFKLEKRKLPLNLGYLLSAKTIVSIEVPDGYELESIPENVKVLFNNGVGRYKYVTSFKDNTVFTTVYFDMEATVVQPNEYEAFKDFFETIVEKDAEKIVLKKIE